MITLYERSPRPSTPRPGSPTTTKDDSIGGTKPPRPHNREPTMYTISTTSGDRVDTAATIPEALAALATQLTDQLPHGPVQWKITDPAGSEHRGTNALNGCLDLPEFTLDELVEDLYTPAAPVRRRRATSRQSTTKAVARSPSACPGSSFVRRQDARGDEVHHRRVQRGPRDHYPAVVLPAIMHEIVGSSR